jgi:glycosyltransferase involved in cell wall biosynthesis
VTLLPEEPGTAAGDCAAGKPVLWLANEPTPYLDFLFERLAQSRFVNLTVIYLRRSAPKHPWGLRLRNVYPYLIVSEQGWWRATAEAVRLPGRLVVVGGWRRPFMAWIAAVLMSVGGTFGVWTDTPRLRSSKGVVTQLLRTVWLRLLFRKAACVLGTGRNAVAVLARMGCPARKLLNLPYFIDNRMFSPPVVVVPREPRRHVTLASTGRLVVASKGLDIALKAVAATRDRLRGGVQFKYQLIGEGPDREALGKLIAALGLADTVTISGWMQPADLSLAYGGVDGLIHAARFEPYGVAVLEGMACGLTVFASSATEAAVDRIVDGENGFIHPVGDYETLSTQLVSCIASPSVFAAMGKRARETAEQWDAGRAVATVRRAVALAEELG